MMIICHRRRRIKNMIWLKKIEGAKCPWCGKEVQKDIAGNCDLPIKFYCSLEVGMFIVIGTLFFFVAYPSRKKAYI